MTTHRHAPAVCSLIGLVLLLTGGCGSETPPPETDTAAPAATLAPSSDSVAPNELEAIEADSGSGAVVVQGQTAEPSHEQSGQLAVSEAPPKNAGSIASEQTNIVEEDPAANTTGDPVEGTESVAGTADQAMASEAVASEAMDTEMQSRPPPAYRIWLPTTKGPVVVGVDVLLDDQPLGERFTRKVDEILESASSTDDQPPTWEELLDYVAANPNQFGNSAANVSGQKSNLIRAYDRNQNRRVEVEESLRFLLRDSRVSSEFRLFGTNAYRWNNFSTSRVFRALDQDGNQKLDPSEIASATDAILIELDSNSDTRIEIGEVIETPVPNSMNSGMNDAWGMRRSRRHGNVAMDLHGYVDWSNLSYTLSGMFGSSPMWNGESLVESLDADGNESIDSAEAEELLNVEIPVRVTVRFSDGASEQPSVTAQVAPQYAESVKVASATGNRLTIASDTLSLSVTIADQLGSRNRIPLEAFEMLDANDDGGLDADEIPDGVEDQFSFESLDEDEDGKLSYEEINRDPSYVQSIWGYQVRARAAEFPDGLFAWLDQDHDRILSAREIGAASRRMESLIGDDAFLKPNAFPDHVLMQFGRGQPNQDAELFRIRANPQRQIDNRPNWAIQMDANRDGDISHDEFTGPIEQFEKMDSSGDGFLGADELN